MKNEIYELINKIKVITFKKNYNNLSKINLYPGQHILLDTIYKNNGLSQRDLSKMTLKTPATITKMIKRMEKEGLIKIIADESDKRITRLELTDLGMEKIYKIKELENKLADNKDLELSRKEKLEQINNITKILKKYKGLNKFNEEIFNNLVDRIIIGEKLNNGKENLYKIKFIFKTGEMIKDNLPNNKLKIGSDMGHYGFSINKQSLEIKEDNVSAYVLRKNPHI